MGLARFCSPLYQRELMKKVGTLNEGIGAAVWLGPPALDDNRGGAHNHHDANFLTFHRFTRLRSQTQADSGALNRVQGETSRR